MHNILFSLEIILAVMHAHRGGNQSEIEKDNRLLFGEQWILLYFKSEMAT